MLNSADGAGPTGLRTGTKVATIISALLLAVAVYFFVSPTSFRGKDGSLFGCGSPMSPNTSGLAKGQCNIIENHALHHALLALAMALIVGALGYVLFGTHGSSRPQRTRQRLDDDDDDERRDVRARRRARLGDEDEPASTRGASRARLSDERDESESGADEMRARRRVARLSDDDRD